MAATILLSILCADEFLCALGPRLALFAQVIFPSTHLVPAATEPMGVQVEPSQREKVVSEVHLSVVPPLAAAEVVAAAAAAAGEEEEVGLTEEVEVGLEEEEVDWTARLWPAPLVNEGATEEDVLALVDVVPDGVAIPRLVVVVLTLVGAVLLATTRVLEVVTATLLEEPETTTFEPEGEMVTWRF